MEKTKGADNVVQSTNEMALPHALQLEERNKLTVSGVSDVDSFDEGTVVVYTSLGELTVRGEGLHILKLNTDTGELMLEGTVREMTYAAVRARSDSFFGKLFR